MNGTNTLDVGGFGLSGAQLVIRPEVPPDALAFDALVIVQQALAVFDAIADAPGDRLHPLHFSGLSLLRQASIVIDAMQMTPEEGEAVAALRRKAGAQ